MSGLDERPFPTPEPAPPSAREAHAETDVRTEPEGPPSEPAKIEPTGESALTRTWQTVKPWLALLDFARRPDSKAGWVVRAAVFAIALVALFRRVDTATRPLLSAKSPPAIPTEEVDDYKFRLPERTRHDIFNELAAAELSERARAIAANTWNGHLWSREDDRGHYERVAVRAVASKYKISLSQTYLVLDEGIRERWPGPDGKPLPATTPPLNIRSNSW